MKIVSCAVLVCLIYINVVSGIKLTGYNIDKSKITISGISSGGSMATQMHIAYSSTISGVGIVTGPPFYCAAGSVNTATTTCMSGYVGTVNSATIISTINSWATAGKVDSTANLKNAKVYNYHGTADTTVVEKVAKKNEEIYSNYNSLIKGVYTYPSAHGFITNNFGGACGTASSTNYINNCNYNQAYDMLKYLYDLTTPEPDKNIKATETLLDFDQGDFFPSGSSASTAIMDTLGYIYVPKRCAQGNVCKLHFALHGCLQGKYKIGNVFAANTGYNEVADANDIIIVYPQAVSSVLSNPNGCWDWWGFTNANYSNKLGVQMQTLKSMIDKLSSGSTVTPPTTPTTTQSTTAVYTGPTLTTSEPSGSTHCQCIASNGQQFNITF